MTIIAIARVSSIAISAITWGFWGAGATVPGVVVRQEHEPLAGDKDCTEEVKVCCGQFSVSMLWFLMYEVSLFRLVGNSWAPAVTAEQPLHVDTQHVCE